VPAGSLAAGAVPAGSLAAGGVPAGSLAAGGVPAGSVAAGGVPAGSLAAAGVPAGSVAAGGEAAVHAHEPYFRTAPLAAGAYSAYAIAAGGQVWAWGDGVEGQLGNGSDYTTSEVPVRVLGLSRATAIFASDNSAYALQGGRVWAWGDDGQGQDGNGVSRYTEQRPSAVGHLSAVTAVAGGGYSAYALGPGGTVWAWGDNSSGQVGLSLSVAGSNVPVAVAGLARVRGLAAGTSTAYALEQDGSVWAWGDNAFLELGGRRSVLASPVPAQVPGVRGAVAVAASGFSAYALLRDGTVWAWGDGSFGELGLRTCPGKAGGCPPGPVPGLSHVVAIAAGGQAAYALAADGVVWAWGGNGYGQLGDGTLRASATPVRVARLRRVLAIAAGGTSAYAMSADGNVWAWGSNAYGQLGDGSTTPSDLPVKVGITPGTG
jgi:alpha-tubulin suppressor-like RCC1 family protein